MGHMGHEGIVDAAFRGVAFAASSAGAVLLTLARHGHHAPDGADEAAGAAAAAFRAAGCEAEWVAGELRVTGVVRGSDLGSSDEQLWADLALLVARPCYVVWHGDDGQCWRYIMDPRGHASLIVQHAAVEALRLLPELIQTLQDVMDALPPGCDQRAGLGRYIDGMSWVLE